VITPSVVCIHQEAFGHHHNCIDLWLTAQLGPSDRNNLSVSDQRWPKSPRSNTRMSSMEVAITQDSLAWNCRRRSGWHRCGVAVRSSHRWFEEPRRVAASGGRTAAASERAGIDNLAEVRRLVRKMGAADKDA